MSVGTNGWSNSLSGPKFDLQAQAGQVDAERATTANHDARLREWPRSEAIVRVRLEGPSLAAHLAGRTGTRGEWIEIFLPFIRFQASYRGRLLPDHPILNRRKISQIGLMVSDKQKGGFSLEFKRIGFLDK